MPALQRAAARPASGQISRSQDHLSGAGTRAIVHKAYTLHIQAILCNQMIQPGHPDSPDDPALQCLAASVQAKATAELTRACRLDRGPAGVAAASASGVATALAAASAADYADLCFLETFSDVTAGTYSAPRSMVCLLPLLLMAPRHCKDLLALSSHSTGLIHSV